MARTRTRTRTKKTPTKTKASSPARARASIGAEAKSTATDDGALEIKIEAGVDVPKRRGRSNRWFGALGAMHDGDSFAMPVKDAKDAQRVRTNIMNAVRKLKSAGSEALFTSRILEEGSKTSVRIWRTV